MCRGAFVAATAVTIAVIPGVFDVGFCGALGPSGRNIYPVWNMDSPEVVIVFYNR